ncbi:MAG: hypothetical protein IJM12_04095, partial [Bacteroidales bacterium]|nr:hypothetical protein [Bacteroidales bacterium]
LAFILSQDQTLHCIICFYLFSLSQGIALFSPARLLGQLSPSTRRSTSRHRSQLAGPLLKPLGLLFCASFFQRTSSDYETVCLVSNAGAKVV